MGVVARERGSRGANPGFLPRLVGVETRYQAKHALWFAQIKYGQPPD
jgi:hypothetical protein